MYRDMTYRRR